MRYFNVSGPCNYRDHYMVEAAKRLKGVEQLIDMNQYFVIHAARQSGKTTYLQDLARRLNAAGKYQAVYCSLESLQRVDEPAQGIPAIFDCLMLAFDKYSVSFSQRGRYEQEKFTRPTVFLTAFLMDVVKESSKPLVILFDEADCLSDGTLISFLRQLRMGYNDRGIAPFVHSIALVGMRNIRDYKAKIRPDSESLGSASPFNIVTESLTLTNFTREEIGGFYGQHTEESGQRFEDDAVDLILQKSQGQPWLVNAIAREVIVKLLQSDYTKPVTAALAEQAIENIILRRDTHIDSLLERLKEARVRRVIEPMIAGESFTDWFSDDYLYTKDLGLVVESQGGIQPANPIYGEVIARTLSYAAQQEILKTQYASSLPYYLKNGRIDMDLLLADFQAFWRENSAIWQEKIEYKEAAPHLILQAFLQRVINSGGDLNREMATGAGRTDLCVLYNGQKYPIELKIRRGDKTRAEGSEQTRRYMDILGCAEGWLAIFDQRPDISWDEKIYLQKETINGKTVTVVGL